MQQCRMWFRSIPSPSTRLWHKPCRAGTRTSIQGMQCLQSGRPAWAFVGDTRAQQPRCRRTACRPACAAGGSSAGSPTVVATREQGKNGKLIAALAKHDVQCIELPLIEHGPGPDRDQLPGLLAAGGFDWVTITSPEAAHVFLEGWRQAGSPPVRISVVGGGTGEILQQAGLQAGYTASKATGKVMGAELPHVPGGTDVVLYPASAKASTDLQDSLAANGFTVKRISTYDTVGVKHMEPQQLQQALGADIVTFGSPSAVKAWVALVGLEAAKAKACVCIGSTSARACEAAGLLRIRFPDSPGIEGWVDCVLEEIRELQRQTSTVAA